MRAGCALLLLALFAAGAAGQTFVDVTATALPGLATEPGRDGRSPDYTGGAAIGDCDGDGLPDVYLTGAGHDVLYRNHGDGTFEDATLASGLGGAGGTRGAAFADVDNDGDLDLYATGYAEARHLLYINDGHCRFTEQALERGVAVGTRAIGRSVSFGDYDADGWLDAFVTELQSDAIDPGVPRPVSHLFHNRGAAAPGFFDDVTIAAGVAVDQVQGTQSGTFPFVGRFTDLDRDGRPDIAVVSDFHESRLFWNDGNGHFTDGTVAAGVGTDEHGMAGTTGDFDGDGLFDLFVTSILIPPYPNATGNRLYRNLGDRTFADTTDHAGVRDGSWGWGTDAFDYDNDGDLDLVMTDGAADGEGSRQYLEGEFGPVDLTPFATDPPRLWRNDGHGVFTEVAAAAGLTDPGLGQGAIAFDYDGDGDLDVLLTHDCCAPPVLYRNDGGNARHWLDVELVGRRANPRGIGAIVTATPVRGGPALVREVSASSTYLVQNGTGRVHLGLGEATSVDLLRIEWPGGTVQTLRNLSADGVQRIAEDCGNACPDPLETHAQRACITGLNAAGAAIAAAAGRNLLLCLRDASAGRLGTTVAACMAADRVGRVARRRDAAERLAAARCGAAPDFGPRAAADVEAAFASPLRLAEILGVDVDGAVAAAATDAAAAACQRAGVDALVRLVNARVRAFNRCKASGVRRGIIASAADLAACLDDDARGIVARALAKAGGAVGAACGGMPPARAFPGRCASAAPADLAACLANQAECSACLALDAADRLSGSCDRYRSGVAFPICGDRPASGQTIAREWDEEILDAIRHDTPRPTVHARNLLHLAAVVWDAWRAYGGGGLPFLTDESHASADPDADRATAISFAAYRLLSHRYALSPNARTTQAHLDARMAAHGFDTSFTSADGEAPAAVGNRIGYAMIAYGRNDGADEDHNYIDPTYTPVNQPLTVKLPGTVMADPKRWQPLALDVLVTQNGIVLPDKIQTAIGLRWNGVAPFALTRTDSRAVYIDPGPPPHLDASRCADDPFRQAAVRSLELSSELTPDDGVTIDVSPGAYGDNPLGTNDGTGRPLNPVTGAPYAPQVVKRGDFGRVMAEFWADGPNSETPPGHWNVLANQVSDRMAAEDKRIGGTGPVVGALEWDVKLYLALGGAVHDAAVVAWGLKRKYDSVRPISMIRWMGERGQCSDPSGPSYDPAGLPLVPGLIEVVTPESSAPGERHEALAPYAGEIAVRAWPGQPASPTTAYSGVAWTRARTWVPYQKATFVTPAFPAYTSGHSTFSRAAAEVLTAITGSPFFPGGLAEFVAGAGAYLTFERGPTTDVRLQWATYYDAADQAGQSRLWGGIHIPADDFNGRITGSEIGLAAWAKAQTYFQGP